MLHVREEQRIVEGSSGEEGQRIPHAKRPERHGDRKVDRQRYEEQHRGYRRIASDQQNGRRHRVHARAPIGPEHAKKLDALAPSQDQIRDGDAGRDQSERTQEESEHVSNLSRYATLANLSG